MSWASQCDVTWPCRKTLRDVTEVVRLSVQGAFDADCVPDYSQACPDRYSLEGSTCKAPSDFSGRCGYTVPSKYDAAERAAYADACLAPWPCVGDYSRAALK